MIEIKNIEKSFDGIKILKGVSAVFEAGKTNLIIGQSGSGKTVMLKSLLGIHTPETGTISFATNGELRKIPIKELRASLVNELQWFKSSDEGGQAHES